MRALTLHQPWASLMAWGLKTIETRSWQPPPQALGWLAIHAGKNRESIYNVELLVDDAREAVPDHPALKNVPSPLLVDVLPLGAIVAVGHLIGAQRSEQLVNTDLGTNRPLGNFEPGRYGWIFDRVIALPGPIACRGMQGLWTVPADIADALDQPPCGACAHQWLDHRGVVFDVGAGRRTALPCFADRCDCMSYVGCAP